MPGWTALAAVSWFLAAVRPAALAWLYDPWMLLVRPIAALNTWLICAALFYLVVTPYGLLLRLFGGRPLALAREEKDSYWEEKAPRDPAVSARDPF